MTYYTQSSARKQINTHAYSYFRELGQEKDTISNCLFTPFPAELPYLNFHPLEIVSRYRDPQLQVAENYSYLFNFIPNINKY